MQRTAIKTLLSIAGTAFTLTSAAAADGSETSKQLNLNTTLYTLVGIMITLLLIIGILAYILQQLGYVVKEKNRKEKQEGMSKTGIMSILLMVAMLPFSAHAEDTSKAYQLPEAIDGIPFNEFLMLCCIIMLELFVILMLAISIQAVLRAIKGEPVGAETVAARRANWFWDKFNKAATVENEHEILLDHNYDGIQELDNSLPPWWKYGFYLTILVSFIYVYRYHVAHTGLSQNEEFAAEMQKGEEDKAAYLAQAANKVDETNVTALTDAAALATGKEVYIKNCAACHVADGGGNVGPNLTDEYWLHGGSITDVFKSIKYGWQDKGMKSWKDDLSPAQIQQVASYIRSLKGTKPATPKAPQGDIYLEVAKPDSSMAAK